MRPTTMVWLGIRHVGAEGGETVQEFNDSAMECVKHILRVIMTTALRKRFQISIAATEDEMRRGLETVRKQPADPALDSATDLLAGIMAGWADDPNVVE